MESLVFKRVTNLVDVVFILHYRDLILLPQHDCQPFPPSMKCNAFGVLTIFVILGNFCNFFLYLSTRSPKMESLVLKRVTNLVHLVFLLHYRHLILLAQHDSQPFPPSRKCSAFGLLTLFVILGNFCNFLVYLSTRSPKTK